MSLTIRPHPYRATDTLAIYKTKGVAMRFVFNMLTLWLVMGTAHAGGFHQLEEWFDNGQKISLEEDFGVIEGTWTGRCYTDKASNVPMAAIVEFFYSERSQHGPAFDGEDVHKVLLQVNSEVDADFYDRDAPSLTDTSPLSSWRDLEDCVSSLCFYDYKGESEVLLFLRKHGEYLVTAGGQDDNFARCYYFRPDSGE